MIFVRTTFAGSFAPTIRGTIQAAPLLSRQPKQDIPRPSSRHVIGQPETGDSGDVQKKRRETPLSIHAGSEHNRSELKVFGKEKT